MHHRLAWEGEGINMEWLHNLLGGSSPITGYLGSLIMLLDVLNQVLIVQDWPKNAQEWIVFIGAFCTGLSARMAKDANKSHAQDPQPVAQPVKAVAPEPPYGMP